MNPPSPENDTDHLVRRREFRAKRAANAHPHRSQSAGLDQQPAGADTPLLDDPGVVHADIRGDDRIVGQRLGQLGEDTVRMDRDVVAVGAGIDIEVPLSLPVLPALCPAPSAARSKPATSFCLADNASIAARRRFWPRRRSPARADNCGRTGRDRCRRGSVAAAVCREWQPGRHDEEERSPNRVPSAKHHIATAGRAVGGIDAVAAERPEAERIGLVDDALALRRFDATGMFSIRASFRRSASIRARQSTIARDDHRALGREKHLDRLGQCGRIGGGVLADILAPAFVESGDHRPSFR